MLVGTVQFGVRWRLVAALLEHGPVQASSPFANVAPWNGATWFEPALKAGVTYAEVMQGRLRDPVLRRIV
jgi:hypothetical protein